MQYQERKSGARERSSDDVVVHDQLSSRSTKAKKVECLSGNLSGRSDDNFGEKRRDIQSG